MNRQQTSQALRGKIVGMRQAGKDIKAIVRELGIARNTVRRWIRREEETGEVKNLRKYSICKFLYHMVIKEKLRHLPWCDNCQDVKVLTINNQDRNV